MMNAAEFQLPVNRQTLAFVRVWQPAAPPRGVLQIVHGMAEHSGRYARFAEAAAEAGFAVYAQDLPGHGRSARAPDELGHFADTNGWKFALQSIRCLQREAAERHPGTPAFILGHSMGSFLVQDYITRHARDLAGAVLAASTGDAPVSLRAGLLLMRAEAWWAGGDHRSRLAHALTFGPYNRRFRPNRTPFDWLSGDADEVDRYIADPHCGFVCSTALWRDVLGALARLSDERLFARVPKSLPVLAVSGELDPVAGAKGPRSLERRYRKAGLKDVTARSYPGARHELLHDHCRDEVTRDLLAWLTQRADAAKAQGSSA